MIYQDRLGEWRGGATVDNCKDSIPLAQCPVLGSTGFAAMALMLGIEILSVYYLKVSLPVVKSWSQGWCLVSLGWFFWASSEFKLKLFKSGTGFHGFHDNHRMSQLVIDPGIDLVFGG